MIGLRAESTSSAGGPGEDQSRLRSRRSLRRHVVRTELIESNKKRASGARAAAAGRDDGLEMRKVAS
ncbi:hypothetical protein MRX96_038015 [Rhipicephalus microplus]